MRAALRFLAVSETARIKGEDARITKRTRLSREIWVRDTGVRERGDERLDPLIASARAESRNCQRAKRRRALPQRQLQYGALAYFRANR